MCNTSKCYRKGLKFEEIEDYLQCYSYNFPPETWKGEKQKVYMNLQKS